MVTTVAQRGDDKRTRNDVFRDYLALTKPRIVLLLLFTTVTAMMVAVSKNGTSLDPLKLVVTCIGGALSASGASVLNQWFDRDLDIQMTRTRNRPIPAGRIRPMSAFIFGIILLVASTLLLGQFVNWLTAGLSLFGAVYYVVGYTMLLKRNTVLNILIGGGAGAMPVLVGWAAVMGSLEPAAYILFAIVFYWTPPHSWALALLVNTDYERAKVPMMPVAHGQQAAREQILLYSIQLLMITLLPVPLRFLGWFYGVAALLLGIGLIWESMKLIREQTGAAARRTYKYSTFYLALLFLAMIIDTLVR